MTDNHHTLETVKQYYGKTLKTNADLKTNACCTLDAMPAHLKPILSQIHPEVLGKFYGCGSPIPAVLEGKTVLDLGCGTGRDTFLLSKLVGPNGKVIGVDMTAEQLAVAKRHVDYHAKGFGYEKSNVEFFNGYIEDLEGLGIKTGSIDVVVSNCVINLSPEKRRVFSEIFRVLKPGGELYFADIFSDRRIPKQLANDPTLVGECLGGALYTEDFRRLMTAVGCLDHRVVTQRRLTVENPELERQLGAISFYSVTVRAFKLNLEDRCEDYGQVGYYLGTIPQCPHAFPLDDRHLFEKGRPVLVCSNTAAMLTQTRYAPHFRVEGDLSTHYGLFDCGSQGSTGPEPPSNQGCC
ncbi:MAG: methyltransferase domain-containing protein [Deltaproteobacteria bacterium]|nr:methyltransferase domain-containing protein [Deltaproteobacteria bacterium]